MEVSNEDFTIAVDSAKFVANPQAKNTLDGAMALLTFAMMTNEHERVNLELCRMLAQLMFEFKNRKNNGWNSNDKKGWQ